MVEHLARELARGFGERPLVLTRGYGNDEWRSHGGAGAGTGAGAGAGADEWPQVALGADRAAAARRALRAAAPAHVPTVALLDDGFQARASRRRPAQPARRARR